MSLSFLDGQRWGTIGKVLAMLSACLVLWCCQLPNFAAVAGMDSGSSLVQMPIAVADSLSGSQIFQTHCAGCHLNGGNIVRRGKNLKLKTLQKHGYDTIAAISEIVTNGKNNMSAYRDRLSEAEIRAVAAYVLEQANQGWK